MNAPAWYNPTGGAERRHAAPPPLPGIGGPEGHTPPPALPKRNLGAGQHGSLSQPLLPSLPPVMAALGNSASYPALPPPPGVPPPPGAAPALADLPRPPLPSALAAPGQMPGQMQTGGATGGGVIALAMENAQKAAIANGMMPVGALIRSKPPVQDEKPFEIWGLQHRAYTGDELSDAFAMMDLDSHGFIGPQDIRRVLDLCGEGDVIDPEIREMLRLIDSDARGKVNYPEFAEQFVDPPAIFRNFDMHKREHTLDAGDRRSSVSGSSVSEGFIRDLRGQAVKDLMGRRRLTPEFIKQVYQRFVELDVDERGFVCFEDFCFILRRAENDAMRKAFQVFDIERLGELELRQFIVGLSMYTSSTASEKLKFAFMMFDEEQAEEVDYGDVADLFKGIAPHLLEDVRKAHEERMYQRLGLNSTMGIKLDEFLWYTQQYIDELVPASPTPSSVSRSSGTRSSGTHSSGTGTPSSGSRRSGRGR